MTYFMHDDRVKVVNVPGPVNGATGTIIGMAVEGPVLIYIVLLDIPITIKTFVHKAAVIPESCLERI